MSASAEDKFKFLMKVRDKVTGFEGKLTAKTTFPFDPPKWWITEDIQKDGKQREIAVCENRLEIIS